MKTGELLVLQLMEECAEVQQRASKLLRFGPEEVEPGNVGMTNRGRLYHEVLDLMAVLRMLEVARILPEASKEEIERHVAAKTAKVEQYLQYSRELRLVED